MNSSAGMDSDAKLHGKPLIDTTCNDPVVDEIDLPIGGEIAQTQSQDLLATLLCLSAGFSYGRIHMRISVASICTVCASECRESHANKRSIYVYCVCERVRYV